jgi:signal transduction histidine kinase
MTAGIISEIRRLMTDLRPSLLDDLGLIPAVRSFAEGQLGPAGVRVRVEVRGASRRLAPVLEIALFRIFQEAITNVKKHARAASCTLALVFKESSVSARIEDDGCGFDTIASRGIWQAFGLVGIEERVRLLKGTLQINSQQQRGTQINLEIPDPPA